MNATFVDAVDEKGTPGVRRHEHVGLGLAVDVERPDGSRNLLVPVIRDADTMDFRAFLLGLRGPGAQGARGQLRRRRLRGRHGLDHQSRARSAPCSRCRD